MTDEIKSAREIALEKIDRLGEVTEEERLRWKYAPEGEMLASKYLGKGCDLTTELKRYEEKAKTYLKEGAESVLLAGISLPQNEQSKNRNKKAMDGLKIIKKDKAAIEEVFININNIFDHYAGQGEQQREETRESLKAEFNAKLQQAMDQQLGSVAGLEINVENLPQFQEEWRRISANMDMQYISLMEKYKKELKAIK
ncbi:MAG: hypothetical protein MUO92_05625 [Dehalococcoidales bacterium]|nr:hypothetical protein [Dehalococcoidales bacterium]